MRSVGYRQVWEAQDGLIPRQEMRDRGIYATRQLAKRQMTWLSNSFACETFDAWPRSDRPHRPSDRGLPRRPGEVLGQAQPASVPS